MNAKRFAIHIVPCIVVTLLLEIPVPSEEPQRADETRRDDTKRNDETKRNRGLPRELHRASDIIGKKVENEQGENLGKIEDIVLDESQGRIVYAVLSFGGILGLGDKLFAIPWNALKENPDKKVCLLSVDKDKLKKAPGFDKKNWPDMANAQWGQGIHEYYGIAEGYRTLPAVDFGEANLQREPVQLSLALKQGQSYRYRVDMEPREGWRTDSSRTDASRTDPSRTEPSRTNDTSRTDPSRPTDTSRTDPSRTTDGSRTDATHGEKSAEVSFTVIKVEGDKTTIEANCSPRSASSATNTPENGRNEKVQGTTRFEVGKDGQITSLALNSQPGENRSNDKSNESKSTDEEVQKAQMKTRLEHIFGYRLHDQQLQPAKEYTMPGSTRDLLDREPTQRIAEQHRMRYEGVTRVDGNKVALFEIIPGGGATPAGREARPGPSPIFESGKAAYRTDDGLLEVLSYGSTTVRRLSERGEVGN